MDLLRAFSITASSVTLALSIAAFAFASHSEWHEQKRTLQRQHYPWSKAFLLVDLAVYCVTTIGLSISLLVCSIFWNERWIEIFLLLFGRVLLIRHVRMYTGLTDLMLNSARRCFFGNFFDQSYLASRHRQ